MKKIMSLIGLVLIVAVGWFGYKYYSETYQGVEAYGKVPQEVPVKEETKDNQGKAVTNSDGSKLYSYEYNDITFYDKDGNKHTNSFEVTGNNPQPLQPGSYIRAKVSQKRVIEGPNGIQEKDVPEKAKSLLK